jgi:hypothetical protein
MRSFRFLLILSTAALAFGDTVYMKDGRLVAGTFLGGTARELRMDLGDRVETYQVSDVIRIEFQSTAAAAPAPAPVPSPPEPQESAQAPQPSSPSGPLTIPAGTILKVRMIDAVDSEVSQLGQTFQASLDDPIVGPDGATLVERGADMVAKLVEEKQSGKISGRAELTLDLVSIRVNGRTVDLSSEAVTTSSESRGGKSAKVIGGATVVGSILGGIFGGGKGAAIGAVSGAGAGGAVQVLTKGQKVKIPSETRLSFTLQSAVQI